MTYKYDTREVTHGNTTGFFAKISKTESGTLDLKNRIHLQDCEKHLLKLHKNQMHTTQITWSTSVFKVRNQLRDPSRLIKFLNNS
ncbi:major tail protein [Streptococcus phage IPP51]|uniref:Major tail protein n=1 Tax=Streptococcus phage IPP51 TaxID=1916189 RepID=A0A1S5SDT1_9CAUD|nr:major tail protein [Streptococcus phage IPP51]